MWIINKSEITSIVGQIIATVVAYLIIAVISNSRKIAMTWIAETNPNKLPRLLCVMPFWMITSGSIAFSLYKLWSRYGHLEQSMAASIDDVLFISVQFGIIVLMFSMMISMMLFNASSRMHQRSSEAIGRIMELFSDKSR